MSAKIPSSAHATTNKPPAAKKFTKFTFSNIHFSHTAIPPASCPCSIPSFPSVPHPWLQVLFLLCANLRHPRHLRADSALIVRATSRIQHHWRLLSRSMQDRTNPPGVAPDPKRPPSAARSQRREWVVLALILIVAASVRIYHLGYFSLWLDEIFSVATSSGHYPDIRPLEMNRVLAGIPNFTALSDARPWHTIWPA